MKKAALQSGQINLFDESITRRRCNMEVYIFDEAGNRLATCDGWHEAENLIKTMQADGYGTLEARNFIQPRPPENIEYNRQPLHHYPMNCLHELLSPSWVDPAREMRWR